MALAVFAAISFPVAIANRYYWLGLVSGYFWGFFGDVFTKSGVALFYPSQAKAICPGNPRLRLSTGSGAEYFLVGLLTIVAIASIHMNSSGGILKAFNSAVGIPEGAVEIVNSDGAHHLMFVFIKGRNAITQEPVSGEFEVVRPLTATDLLVKNSQGLYRAGTTQNCQIAATQVQTRREGPITATVKEITMDSEDLEDALAQAPRGKRVYVSGMLSLEDAEELNLLSNPQQFPTISIQPAAGASIAHIESASPEEIVEKLGEYYATGTLVVRSINVQP
jgi:inner membrane protein